MTSSLLPPDPRWPDMLRRLRARTVAAWQFGERERAARAAIQRLADLAADAAREQRRTVPNAGLLALPDQLAVLMTDAQISGAPPSVLRDLVDRIGAELSVA